MSQKAGIPKGDVSFIRAVSPAASGANSPSPVGGRDKNKTPGSQNPNMDHEWDDREEIRLRELEEARARAAQMEKTMRWWSDCTANWREKWSKVRNERNKARDENRQLRSKLEALVKECTLLKREKQEFASQSEHLKKQLELTLGDKDGPSATGIAGNTVSVAGNDKSGQVTPDNADSLVDHGEVATKGGISEFHNLSEMPTGADDLVDEENEFVDNIVLQNDSADGRNMAEKMERLKQNRKLLDDVPSESSEGSLAEEKLALLELKLDESQKTIFAERDEKAVLMKSLEKMQVELNSVRSKYEDSKRTRQDAVLEVSKLKEDHKEEIDRMLVELEDESSSRTTMDRRIGELRRELEKLQRENADEWGKRERLETEKFGLERENKKLRIQIEDLEDQLEKKNQQTTVMLDSDMKTLQFDLSEKNKELNELRHAHAKLKKTFQEKLTDLDHAKRRAEQYEGEVKKLRIRVEELKKDLATAEDEVDTQANNVRKVQRSNDELQEQVENLTVQVDHLQSRLRRSSQPVLKSRTSSVKSYNPEEAVETHGSDIEDIDGDS